MSALIAGTTTPKPIPGMITASQIPAVIPDGLFESCNFALLAVGYTAFKTWSTNGFMVSDLATVLHVLTTYTNSSWQLQWLRQNSNGTGSLDVLDSLATSKLNWLNIADASSAVITELTIGTYLMNTINNYRMLRTQINAAVTVAGLQAINIQLGWPTPP